MDDQTSPHSRAKHSPRKIACLANPTASSWLQAREQIHALARQVDASVIRLEPGSDWFDRACELEVDRLVLCGGDGTVSGVVNELHERSSLDRFDFAVLPMGTGNDFSRSIGFCNLPLDQAWERIVHDASIPVDVIQIDDGRPRLLVNAATAGFGGLVTNDLSSEEKESWGAMAYWMAAFSRLASLQEYELHLRFNGDRLDVRSYGLAIASGKYAGGGFPITPNSLVNDGMLDVTVVPVMPMTEIIAAGMNSVMGQLGETESVMTFQASTIEVIATPQLPYSLDGESTESIDAKFSVIPGAIRMVTEPSAIAVADPRRNAASAAGHFERKAV
ncbi:diacylglycerol kinase family lipid kinase [Roseiconus nitratireducens]|uniref:Diacylglycerol kinase family lipid kinase n=1 Tax=Roseiconus nitratireducens TaxID=2605748 RepID=A0A5M6CYA8_9BACT|nr:diacylglycerol kinase family protein [Roseiconus nitratireducens]KAA5539410.1 diacylglycerol kinase family lipid kinase [Roseiconus nitratireducens]